MHQVSEYICRLDERYVDHFGEWDEVYEPGYYFRDEASQLNGPFDSAEEAERALKQYMESFY